MWTDFASCGYLAVLPFVIHFGNSYAMDMKCPDFTWINYKDEKCLKLLPVYDTQPAAIIACQSIASNTNNMPFDLLTINSEDQQIFIEKWLFDNSIVDHIWLGAKRNEDNDQFKWSDGEQFLTSIYTNWANDNPKSYPGINCVELVPSDSNNYNMALSKGQNVRCNKRNMAVCQLTSPVTGYRKLLKARQELLSLNREVKNLTEQVAGQTLKIQTLQDEKNQQDLLIQVFTKNQTLLGSEIQNLTEYLNASNTEIKTLRSHEDLYVEQINKLISEKWHLDGNNTELKEQLYFKTLQIQKCEEEQNQQNILIEIINQNRTLLVKDIQHFKELLELHNLETKGIRDNQAVCVSELTKSKEEKEVQVSQIKKLEDEISDLKKDQSQQSPNSETKTVLIQISKNHLQLKSKFKPFEYKLWNH